MEIGNWKFIIFNTMPVKPKKNKLEKDIEQVVEKIPGLIFEQVEFKNLSPKNKINQNKHQQEKKRKTMVWTGVIILTVIIIIMWSWSTFVNFDTLLKKDTTSIIDQAKESFDTAKIKTDILEPKITTPTTTETKSSDEEIKMKIENSLDILINELKKVSSTGDIITSTANQFPIEDDTTTTNPNKI